MRFGFDVQRRLGPYPLDGNHKPDSDSLQYKAQYRDENETEMLPY